MGFFFLRLAHAATGLSSRALGRSVVVASVLRSFLFCGDHVRKINLRQPCAALNHLSAATAGVRVLVSQKAWIATNPVVYANSVFLPACTGHDCFSASC